MTKENIRYIVLDIKYTMTNILNIIMNVLTTIFISLN
jgi:hypothetical protein